MVEIGSGKKVKSLENKAGGIIPRPFRCDGSRETCITRDVGVELERLDGKPRSARSAASC